MTKARFVILGLALAALIEPATLQADMAPGEEVFLTRCAKCHSLTRGQPSTAPDLTGVVGRRAGALKGYRYTPALRHAHFVWTPQKLDEWLTEPHYAAPETEMAFTGLKSAQDRADVIEFLQHLHAK